MLCYVSTSTQIEPDSLTDSAWAWGSEAAWAGLGWGWAWGLHNLWLQVQPSRSLSIRHNQSPVSPKCRRILHCSGGTGMMHKTPKATPGFGFVTKRLCFAFRGSPEPDISKRGSAKCAQGNSQTPPRTWHGRTVAVVDWLAVVTV